MGFVSANEKHWKALYQANANLGICVTSDDAYQILRGIRTMGIRLAHHQKSALDIATWLESRDDSCVYCIRPCRAFPDTNCGSVISRARACLLLVLKAEEGRHKQAAAALPRCADLLRARLFLGWLRIACGRRLAGRSDHRQGPSGGPVIRLQIGLEDVADLKMDLEAGSSRGRRLTQPSALSPSRGSRRASRSPSGTLLWTGGKYQVPGNSDRTFGMIGKTIERGPLAGLFDAGEAQVSKAARACGTGRGFSPLLPATAPASSNASSIAMAAPWAANGIRACAASPISTVSRPLCQRPGPA